ncbi:MAG: Smr/MutS family protein [Bdellovibrionales bacterium]
MHGVRVEDVFDKVDAFVHKHVQNGTARVKIMPGKGTGAVKAELLKYLKLGGYPSQPETLPSGKKNPGSLIVFLND